MIYRFILREEEVLFVGERDLILVLEITDDVAVMCHLRPTNTLKKMYESHVFSLTEQVGYDFSDPPVNLFFSRGTITEGGTVEVTVQLQDDRSITKTSLAEWDNTRVPVIFSRMKRLLVLFQDDYRKGNFKPDTMRTMHLGIDYFTQNDLKDPRAVPSFVPSPFIAVDFGPGFSEEEAEACLEYVAEVYRSCGGTGLKVVHGQSMLPEYSEVPNVD